MSRARTITGAARAVARLAKQVEVALGPLDLSLPQYRVLALLGEGSTASSVLARRLAVSPPSVTAVVDGLVGRGLVEREADPEDRRRLTLLLTRDGAKLLAAADAAAEARLDEIAGYFDDAADRARPLEPRARPQPRSAPGAATSDDRDGRVRRRRHVAVRPRRRHARVPAAARAHRARARGRRGRRGRWREEHFVDPAHAADRPRAQVDVRLLAARVVHRPRGAGADPQRGRPGDRLAGEDRPANRSSTSSPSSWCSR